VVGSRDSPLAELVQDQEAEEGTGEPEDGAQERKGFGSLPLVAGVAVAGNAAPVEDAAAGAGAEPVDEQTKDNEPEDHHDNIPDPGHDILECGDEQDQGSENGDDGDDFGEDEAGRDVGIGIVGAVDIGAVDTEDDSGEDKLAEAEQEAEETGENHVD